MTMKARGFRLFRSWSRSGHWPMDEEMGDNEYDHRSWPKSGVCEELFPSSTHHYSITAGAFVIIINSYLDLVLHSFGRLKNFIKCWFIQMKERDFRLFSLWSKTGLGSSYLRAWNKRTANKRIPKTPCWIATYSNHKLRRQSVEGRPHATSASPRFDI